MRITPLALAAGLMASAGTARAQTAAAPQPPAIAATAAHAAHAASAARTPSAPAGIAAMEASRSLLPLPRGDDANRLPIVLQAETIRSQPDLETVAEGKVEFRRGGTVIKADRLAYDTAQDLAGATGNVRVSRGGAIYSGPELQLRVQRFEGYFLRPEFEFTQLGAGGRAERIDFYDSARSSATRAEYTSCPRDTPAEPAWVLRTDRVSIDLDSNEGVAEGAVLRFLNVPILALPSLSFPLSDARKSGWLPPSINTDNRSGIELSIPWYWNIAPQRDATLTPRLITRRGLGLDTELRYLETHDEGALNFDWLPNDRLTGRSREALQWQHLGRTTGGLRYSADVVRVSDDEWWKDFPNAGRSLTARLLPARLSLEQPLRAGPALGLAYVRALQWQVLQGSDAAVVSPYERTPQVGVRMGLQRGGWDVAVEAEYNRFTLPSGSESRAGREGGERVHLLGHVSRALREPGWWLVPRLSVNAASYRYPRPGEAQRATRVIPTLSLDAGFELERNTTAFGRKVLQTLEPRVLYVRTPYRAQSQLPNYDAAAKDFNFVSIYTDNQFSGVDRVSDAHQLTAGVTTRFVDAVTGAEALRLGLVQRYLFRSQRVTAQADGSPDGAPLEQRFSDALLLGSTSVLPGWTLDGAVQYNADIQRSVRSILGVRYSPGPFRTIGTTYRLARGLSEQMELGWQWPLYGQPRVSAGAGAGAIGGNSAIGAIGGSNGCRGTWYSVGRVNYSLKDSRITDSVLGLEYDAGCWIGRFVAERMSTGRSEATTRLMLQLELVGLSRIGSNPLRVLKDNIPGYRLLREERRVASPADDRPTAPVHD